MGKKSTNQLKIETAIIFEEVSLAVQMAAVTVKPNIIPRIIEYILHYTTDQYMFRTCTSKICELDHLKTLIILFASLSNTKK